MNGAHSEHKIKNILVNGTPLENNQDKADAFAKSFSDIRSNKNYSSSFLSHKDVIEQNHKDLFTNTPCPEKRCHFVFCHNFAKS